MRGSALIALVAALGLLGCDSSAPAPQAAIRHIESKPRDAVAPAVEPQASATVAANPSVQKPAPGQSPDLSYLPHDAFAAVIVHARRAFESEALSALPYDEIFSSSLDAWSFDPRDVEHWFLCFTPPVEGEPLGTPYSPAAVMRFVRPVDGHKLIATRGEVRTATLGGKTYFVQTGPQPLAFYLPDDRTIVFAAQRQVEKMLSPSSGANPLASRLAALDPHSDFHLIVNVEPLIPVVDTLAHVSGQQISPLVAPYVNALHDVSMITVSADLSGERFLAATIEARNPEAAARLNRLADESDPLIHATYSSFRGMVFQAWKGDASQAVLDITDSIMARTATEFGESGIRLEVAKPNRLDDLGRRLHSALGRRPGV